MRFPSPTLRVSTAVVVTFLLLAAPRSTDAGCAPGQVVLGLAKSFSVGASPMGIVAGDFNNDGNPDLVVVVSHLGSGATGELVFLQGLGSLGPSQFDAPMPFASGSTPLFLAAADLNGDGNLDLVATYLNDNSVAIMLGDGAGHFSTSPHRQAGTKPHHIVLADMNLDGKLDIVVADSGLPSVAVLFQNGPPGIGNGDFGPPQYFALDDAGTGLAVGDVNGDGNPDIVATEYATETLAVLLGSGSGTFPTIRHVPLGAIPYDVTLADVNGDGVLDALVACQGAGGLEQAIGSGDGTFQQPSLLAPGTVSAVRATDFDGDGLLDLLVSVSDYNNVLLLHGNGANGHNDGTFAQRSQRYVGGFPAGLAIADFDLDGLPDAVTTSFQATSFSLLPGVCLETTSEFGLDDVRDVPNDQGGKVWLTWHAHPRDLKAGAVTGYRVWRRIPTPAPAARATPNLRMTISLGAAVFWEAVVTLPAQRLAAYGYTAATPQDSLASVNPYTAFFVTAITADSDVFYDTAVDSGYSVDNLAPAAPTQLSAQYSVGGVTMSWRANAEADLYRYHVHRGNDAFFTPGAGNLVGSPTSPSFHDATGGAFYKVAAVDVHGNVGPFVLVQPSAPVGVNVGLVSSAAGPAGVTLTWYADPQSVPYATLERDDGDGLWQPITSGTPDGGGWLVMNDPVVVPGATYRYRLSWVSSDGPHTSPVVEVVVPGLALSLAGARPNPSTSGALAMRFSLRDASPATLDLFDVNGRRVLSRDVGSLGAGDHVIDLASARLRPGLYLARLSQGGERRQQRVVIVP